MCRFVLCFLLLFSPHLGEHFSHYFFKYFFNPLFCLSFGTCIIQMSSFVIVLQISETVFNNYNLFFSLLLRLNKFYLLVSKSTDSILWKFYYTIEPIHSGFYFSMHIRTELYPPTIQMLKLQPRMWLHLQIGPYRDY